MDRSNFPKLSAHTLARSYGNLSPLTINTMSNEKSLLLVGYLLGILVVVGLISMVYEFRNQIVYYIGGTVVVVFLFKTVLRAGNSSNP